MSFLCKKNPLFRRHLACQGQLERRTFKPESTILGYDCFDNHSGRTVINHPVETVFRVCAPEYLLAYHVGKIAYAYLDIKITSLMDQEAGEQKLVDYLKPLTDCIDIITNRDIMLRGSIKMAATVTTQILIQGKLNTGLKTFYETTKKRVKNYLKTNPTATAEQYLATPDGMLLKASGGPGKNGPSLRDMGGGGPLKTSKDLAPSIPRKVPISKKITDHIFSEDHKAKGILELGKSQDAILESFIQIIKEVDYKGLLKEGSNEVITKINNLDATIRIFVRNGEIINYNGFKGISTRTIGNKIIL